MRSKKLAKYVACVLFLLMIGGKADAAHLVGGEISYTCLGSNVYEIKLRIYRDCAGGGADFDAVARMAIYDQNANLIRTVAPPKGPTVSVPADSTGNSCVSAPPGLCTEYAEYKANVTLAPIPGGYTISHQRCCRNPTISNVSNSGDLGNTYTVRIPPNDTDCNSSPQFSHVAPIVICLNEPLNLPMRVTDPDGDSLHFELCEVFHGGASVNNAFGGCETVIPNPPCPPPYTPISFIPPLTASDPLPASPKLEIDSLTGRLSGKPTQMGQYLVGICVTEYRNGVPLSTVRLDYQFNVSNCISKVVSDMVTPAEEPTMLCDGLTVNFESESQRAHKILWDFGDGSTTRDTSSSPNPSYTYPLPGRYIVTLVANPDLECSDTLKVPFDIKLERHPNFAFSGVFCFEAQEVIFEPVGSYPPDATFEWNFGPDANFPIVDTELPPPIEWDTPGKHYVELTTTVGACEEVKRDSVEISNLSVTVDAGPDQRAKVEDDIHLLASGGTEYYWFSDHPVDFSNPWGKSTIASLREPGDTVKFYVRASDPLGCEGLDSMTVFLGDDSGPINFFTPNGDGVNDMFDISDLNPESDCHLTILNRWGSTVYAKDDYENDWKGVDGGGNPLPDGTYYYILQRNGEVFRKDAVTIMRNRQ